MVAATNDLLSADGVGVLLLDEKNLIRTVAATGDLDAGVVAFGQAVGLVTDLPSAGQVVADLVAGARHAASRLSAIVEP